jgi:alpha-galactosidase
MLLKQQENLFVASGTPTQALVSLADHNKQFICYRYLADFFRKLRQGMSRARDFYAVRLVLQVVWMAMLPPGVMLAQTKPVAVDAGLAMTPPMGWNSWNRFGCDINEQLIRETADALASSGMRDAGYRYLVIDDCWHGNRDTHGDIQPDPARFPAGIKALADYVHGKGLKFGIYSDAGTKTCGGRPGSRGYEFQDAAQYARWGVDYLKYDWCNTSTQNAEASYRTMRDALNSTGRPIVFSMCEWGTAKPWLWAAGVGNLWRTTGDIDDKWEGKFDYKLGTMNIVDQNEALYAFAGPGHWNDPDMLEVGNGGLSAEEYRTHFSLWAMMAAPLIAGNDVRHLNAETRSILLNADVIAVDQDALGRQGRRVRKDSDLEVWSRELSDGNRAVLFFNRGTVPATISVAFHELGYPDTLQARVRDLWQGKDMGVAKGSITAQAIPAHGVVMLTVRP